MKKGSDYMSDDEVAKLIKKNRDLSSIQFDSI